MPDIFSGNAYPLGLSVNKGIYNFALAAQRAEKMNLVLYRAGEDAPACTIPMERFGKSDVFTAAVKLPQNEKYEYNYETDGSVIIDPYATHLTGRNVFGERKGNVRASVSVFKNTKKAEYTAHGYDELILYKMHLRGFTKSAYSKVRGKGTFAGVVEKISYLKELGINGILLMPVIEFDETEGQLGNYWGYAKENFYFAPKASYARKPDKACEEFAEMVQKLHSEGIDVYLEMIFTPDTRRAMIVDCLRYWVEVYGVDGFRINKDIVPSEVILSDPYLAGTKFLAVSWEEVGSVVKRHISGFEEIAEKYVAEYNEGFMYDMRKYLKGDENMTGRVFYQFSKNPQGSGAINYITDNNGFTLADLYSYDQKHNDANLEKNADGSDYNASWNCGAEGVTKRKKVLALRKKMIKNALTVLMLSQGTPMLLAGDEFCSSQDGNNNAYCQDNEVSWLDWRKLLKNRDIFEFTKMLIEIRKTHPVLHQKMACRQMDYVSCGCPDLSFHGVKPWFPDYSSYNRMTGILLCGNYAVVSKKQKDDDFYIMCNMHWEKQKFAIPAVQGKKWKVLFTTDAEFYEDNGQTEDIKELLLEPRSIVVLLGKEI